MPMQKPLENKPGMGVLFHRKVEEGSRRPTLSGGINIDGVEYELAGWERVSKNDKAYISLTIKPVTAHQQFPKQDEERGRWQP